MEDGGVVSPAGDVNAVRVGPGHLEEGVGGDRSQHWLLGVVMGHTQWSGVDDVTGLGQDNLILFIGGFASLYHVFQCVF